MDMSFFHQNDHAQTILDRDSAHLLPVYARYPVVMDHGKGVYLWDTSGNRYLDLMAGLGVNALGHAHPRMVAAMADQAGRMVHLSPQYASRYPGELAERLCDLSGMRGVFYSTGGSEAVEGALKLARTHARQNFSHSKLEIVALYGSYHGRTYGSLSVTGQDKYRLDFGPGLPHVRFVERNDIAGLREAVTDATAAVLMEPLLGEGGVHVLDTEFLAEARGLEFLSIVEDEGLLQQVSEIGAYLLEGLKDLARESSMAVEARGLGLLLGLELNVPMRPLAEQALEEGFMLNSVQGNVMRFLPSFLLQREHVDSAMELLRRLLKVPGAEEHAEQLAAAAV